MTPAELIGVALRASIFMIVLALGLTADKGSGTWVLRHPKALLLVVLAMFVVMPVVAAAVAGVFALTPAVEVALIALAFSPVPPVLPKKAMKAGAGTDPAIGLLAAASILSLVIIPYGVPLLARWFGADVSVPASTIVPIVAATVLVPLVVGLAFRRFAPRLAGRIAGPIDRVGALLLLVGLVPILITAAPAMWSLIGGGTLLACAAFVIVGLLAGHFLAGPESGNQTTLALATATRHPGIALAIAATAAPETPRVAPAILLYLLLGAVISGVYLAIRRKSETAGSDSPAHAGL